MLAPSHRGAARGDVPRLASVLDPCLADVAHRPQQVAPRDQTNDPTVLDELGKIIAAYQHVEDRKFDLVLEAFRATHELLLQQQQALIDEKRSLSAQKTEIPSSEIRRMIFIRKREGEIAAELSDIRRHASLLQLKVQFFCEQHNMMFRLLSLPAVY